MNIPIQARHDNEFDSLNTYSTSGGHEYLQAIHSSPKGPAPEVPFFVVQKQALLPKVPIFETQKWHFKCPNQNSKTTFLVQTFPKYCLMVFFHEIITFKPNFGQISILLIFGPILGIFPL